MSFKKCWGVVMDSFDTSGTYFPYWYSFSERLSHKTSANVVKNAVIFQHSTMIENYVYLVFFCIKKECQTSYETFIAHSEKI